MNERRTEVGLHNVLLSYRNPGITMYNISIVNFHNIAIYCHGQYTVHIVDHIAYIKGSQTSQSVTPKIIIFEVGTPLYLFDSTPQIHVKTADLKAHHASCREAW